MVWCARRLLLIVVSRNLTYADAIEGVVGERGAAVAGHAPPQHAARLVDQLRLEAGRRVRQRSRRLE